MVSICQSVCQCVYQASVKLRSHTYELEESDVKLKLTLCDTVGYGDQVNKEDSFGPIVEYVDSQFEAYLQVRSSSSGAWVIPLFFNQ